MCQGVPFTRAAARPVPALRVFSAIFLSCGALLACRSVPPTRVAPSPATSAAAPATVTHPDTQEEAPEAEAEEETEPNAPVDKRPVGLADCAGTEVAEMLVITNDQPGAPRPEEVARGARQVSTCYVSHSGCAVKRVPGVWVNAGGKLWQLNTAAVKLPTLACPGAPGNPRPAGEGRADRVELAADGAQQVVVNPPSQPNASEYQETTTFVASIATTLYFKTTTYASVCGALGVTTSRYFAHDLLGIKGRFFSEGPPDQGQLLWKASELFKSQAPTSHSFKYVTTLPYYVDGALLFVAQLSAGATDAESDGLSGAYERSVFLPTEWRGINFAYVIQPPAALAAAVTTRNVRVYGWSLLGDAGLAPTSRYRDWTR
jgi:hypothetical protein